MRKNLMFHESTQLDENLYERLAGDPGFFTEERLTKPGISADKKPNELTTDERKHFV